MSKYFAEPIAGTRSDLGEGTLWDDRRDIFVWVDVFDGIVKFYDPNHQSIEEFPFPSMVTYIGKESTGGYIVALGDCLALTDDRLHIKRVIPLDMDLEVVRTNDGNIDARGNLWIGGAEKVIGSAVGELLKIGSDFQRSIHRKGIQIANGVDWSLDGRVMYYIDSAAREISRYEFDPDSCEIIKELSPIDTKDIVGLPDGMCTDSEGNIWVAFYGSGQVINYSPSGEVLHTVHTPTALTTCASFGGNDLKTMFITSVKDYRSPDFAFDSEQDPFGGFCFQVNLPIAGKLEHTFGR
jgi:sugar lactone lactonase YvrE